MHAGNHVHNFGTAGGDGACWGAVMMCGCHSDWGAMVMEVQW
jgi:hypothetical protein